MTAIEAKEQIKALLDSYREKLSALGIRVTASAYFVDSKTFTECSENDKYLDSICGSITVGSDDAKDENDMCGFDIYVEIEKKSSVDETVLKKNSAEFCNILDEFIERLSAAEDKNAFIREESTREKQAYAEDMKNFNEDMKRLQTTTLIIGAAAVLLIFVVAFIVML